MHYYIHLNPVRVGVLKAAETEERALDKALLLKRREVLRNYEWSSYPDYAGLRRKAHWLSCEAVGERLGPSLVNYRREFDGRITRDQLGLDWKGELAAGMLMGSSAVVARWKRLLADQSKSDARSESKRFGLVSWEEVIAAIEKERGQPWEKLRAGPAGITSWLSRSGLLGIEPV